MTPVLLVNKRPPPSESMFMVHYSFFFARKQDASIKKMELTREIVASSYIIIT